MLSSLFLSITTHSASSSSVKVGTLYFDSEKLKEWTGQSQQTLALFEKIRTVGKGK